MAQDFFYPPGSSNSIVVPPGLATAANQVTQIGLENNIDVSTSTLLTRTPTLGQKNMAGSSPVVIASDQSAILVSAASLPLPTGAATAANQATEIASLASIDSKLTSPLAVSGPLTDTQLRASAVPVSLTAVPLPTGAATEATLSSLNGKVTAVNTGAVVVSSSALPTGASTSALQSSFSAKSASAFINNPFDESVITYVGATTDISTVVYKLASVTVNTLTMSYDGSNRLIGVVKT